MQPDRQHLPHAVRDSESDLQTSEQVFRSEMPPVGFLLLLAVIVKAGQRAVLHFQFVCGQVSDKCLFCRLEVNLIPFAVIPARTASA